MDYTKRILFLVLMILWNTLSYSLESIISYYQLLPQNIFEHLGTSPDGRHIKYTFFTDNGIIKTKAIDNSIIEPIVDNKNMFLRIKDNSFNGAQATGDMQEIAIFTQNKRIIYIAASIFHFGGGYGHRFYIHIYKYENHKLKDVTTRVLPKININEFLDPYVDMKRINNFTSKKGDPVYAFNLPQYGTTIKVNVFPGSFFISDEDPQDVADDYRYFIKNLKYEIELLWDENNGIFKIGKK